MPTNTPSSRSRFRVLALAILVLALGWNARAHHTALPPLIGDYAPDTLWALLVFLVVLSLRPQLSTLGALRTALAFSYAIEVSQLYQAPWINAIRDTKPGGLLLGHGFLWSDLLCYTIGIAIGAILDTYWLNNCHIPEAKI